MANLNAAARRGMPASEFAGPGRSFPVNDQAHARLAIGGATRSMHAGNISASEADRIKARARSVLDQKRDHALSKASATHLHKAGHITKAHHDAIHAHADRAMAALNSDAGAVKPPAPPAFGSLSGAGHLEGDVPG